MRTRTTSAIVLTILVAGCGQDSTSPISPSPPPSTVLAFGRVIDGSTNRGVPGMVLQWIVTSSNFSTPPAAPVPVTTDGTGGYSVALPLADSYAVSDDSRRLNGLVRLPSRRQATDFTINSGACPLRYGTIIDSATRLPIAGARVGFAGIEADSDVDGSYRISVPCRPGTFGIGTTSIGVTHPSYLNSFSLDGRSENLGVPGERRLDWALTAR